MLCESIIKTGRKELGHITKTRESLKEQGCLTDDIETAIDLMACIVFFDKEIFKKNAIDSLFYCYASGHETIASYNPPAMVPGFSKGIYQVRVRDLHKDLTNWRTRTTFFQKNGKPGKEEFEDYREATLEEKLVAKGSHEVRHRFQLTCNPAFLYPYGIYYDSQINSYIKDMREIMEKDIEKFYRNYAEEARPAEFDARVMERMVLGEFANKTSKSKICDIIKTNVNSIGNLQ